MCLFFTCVLDLPWAISGLVEKTTLKSDDIFPVSCRPMILFSNFAAGSESTRSEYNGVWAGRDYWSYRMVCLIFYPYL